MRALGGGLIDGEEGARAFYVSEVKTMLNVGWPMLVSFFCRMGMASEDSAFVGHLRGRPGHPDNLSQGLLGPMGTVAVGYAFLASLGGGGDDDYGPEDYLAAAGLSDMVVNILIIPPLAFNQSLNALVSQAMGSGNKKKAGTWLQLSVIWLTIGYIPVLFAFFYVGPILKLFGFSPKLCQLANSYSKYNVFWPIPNGWYQCMRFYFQAQGITRPAMYNNIFFLAVNAVLNWVFVFGGPFRSLGFSGLGFVGAAISLSCSRSMQPLFYWVYMFAWKKAHVETWPSWKSRTFMDKDNAREFLKMSVPQIGTLIFQAVIGQATTLLISKLGKMAIAASAAATAATQTFTGGLQPTLAAVGGMRVGFYLGQGEAHAAKARRVALLSLALGAAAGGIVTVVLLVLGRAVVGVVTNDKEVKDAAVSILPAILVNVMGAIVVQVGTGGILTSQGRTKLVTLLSMGIELPLSLGSTALLVLVFSATLNTVYWVQAIVTLFEAAIVVIILQGSDWQRYAQEAVRRQAVTETEVDCHDEAAGGGAHGISMHGPQAEQALFGAATTNADAAPS